MCCSHRACFSSSFSLSADSPGYFSNLQLIQRYEFQSQSVHAVTFAGWVRSVIEDMPEDMFPDRPWGKGNNPKTAVLEYLKTHPEFEIDQTIPNKLMLTVARDGYLKRIR